MLRHLRIAFVLLALVPVAVMALAIPSYAAASAYDWPIAGDHPVTREFDNPAKPWLPGHRGVDLGTVAGAPVLAAGNGVIAFAGDVAGKPVVSIDHPDGVRTTYEPVAASVSKGQVVTRGQPIGTVVAGHLECSASACLHWGARRGKSYIDPLSLLKPRVVRLLPL